MPETSESNKKDQTTKVELLYSGLVSARHCLAQHTGNDYRSLPFCLRGAGHAYNGPVAGDYRYYACAVWSTPVAANLNTKKPHIHSSAR
ncbi:MAG: hypothetical protein EOO60_00605 [Hymenobacter sp.]|nr:MAG: hypothetical protein EOO60_00605 [Hymenobacter sp.]